MAQSNWPQRLQRAGRRSSSSRSAGRVAPALDPAATTPPATLSRPGHLRPSGVVDGLVDRLGAQAADQAGPGTAAAARARPAPGSTACPSSSLTTACSSSSVSIRRGRGRGTCRPVSEPVRGRAVGSHPVVLVSAQLPAYRRGPRPVTMRSPQRLPLPVAGLRSLSAPLRTIPRMPLLRFRRSPADSAPARPPCSGSSARIATVSPSCRFTPDRSARLRVAASGRDQSDELLPLLQQSNTAAPAASRPHRHLQLSAVLRRSLESAPTHRGRVPELSPSYRGRCVKHLPGRHTWAITPGNDWQLDWQPVSGGATNLSALVRAVELRGIEPRTSSMRTKRATNCATAPRTERTRERWKHYQPAGVGRERANPTSTR